MKLITAQEAKDLVKLGVEWRQHHLREIMELTMKDIHDAALAGKTAITVETIASSVDLPAFQQELVRLGFTVTALEKPFLPRSIEIMW